MINKEKPAGVEPAGAGWDARSFATDDSNHTTNRRRLQPREAALIKLDSVEHRLQAARAIGNDDAWVRYYLAWLKLYSVAFGPEVQRV